MCIRDRFDANTIEPSASYEPIAAGWYKAVFTSSEEKPTKAMTGSYLQLGVEIIEGQHQGRKLIERLNLKNPNPTAVEIAQRTLSSICHAVSVMTPKSGADLHDKPFMVKVAVKPADGAYGPSNDIKECRPQQRGWRCNVRSFGCVGIIYAALEALI